MFGNDIDEDWLLEEFEHRLWKASNENMHALKDYNVHGVMAIMFGTLAAYHTKEADKYNGRAKFALLVSISLGAVAAMMLLFAAVASLI